MELNKVLEGFTVSNTLVIKAQVQVIRSVQLQSALKSDQAFAVKDVPPLRPWESGLCEPRAVIGLASGKHLGRLDSNDTQDLHHTQEGCNPKCPVNCRAARVCLFLHRHSASPLVSCFKSCADSHHAFAGTGRWRLSGVWKPSTGGSWCVCTCPM